MTLDARLLRALRASCVHLPAHDLAAQAASLPDEIRLGIHRLREAGFEIEEHPALGFRLLAAPDRLTADDLASRLEPGTLAQRIMVFAETASTNNLAMQQGRQGAPAGLVIFAEHQRAGRGRFGRRWESSSHRGLWFSLLLRPALPLSAWPRLTTWAAVSIAAALESCGASKAVIKWPNDVFLGGRKVAGILMECGTEDHGGQFAVLGMGVNANQESSDFPPELRDKAASLAMVMGRSVDRVALAAAILQQLEQRWPLLANDFPAILREATTRSCLLGQWIGFHSGSNRLEGLAERLDEHGRLVVRLPDDSETCLNGGEVTLAGN